MKLSKALFALSPVIFAMIGYVTGHQIGYGAAKAEYENYSLAHDETLKGMGVCLWAEAVARRIECGTPGRAALGAFHDE